MIQVLNICSRSDASLYTVSGSDLQCLLKASCCADLASVKTEVITKNEKQKAKIHDQVNIVI